MNIFAEEKINKGRQIEIDILKAVCIFFMIMIHVFDDDISPKCSLGGWLVDYVGVMTGAACFMIAMGIGMQYAKNQSPKAYIIRGVAILTVGQMLNILRNSLANLIGYWLVHDNWFIANAFLVIQSDILTFAGIAFFLMAILKKLKCSEVVILVIGFAMNIANWILFVYMSLPESYLANQLLGYFVITKAECYFPLMSYFVFVAAGYWIGSKYPYIQNKPKLSTRVLVICVPICAVYYAFRFPMDWPYFPKYSSDLNYSMYPGPDALMTIMVGMILLALFYKLSHLAGDRIPRFMAHMSENINSYYCISYMIILPLQTILMILYGRMIHSTAAGYVLTIVIVFTCAGIIELNKKYIHFSVVSLSRSKLGRAALIGSWVLTVVIVVYTYPRITEFANIWNDYLLPQI